MKANEFVKEHGVKKTKIICDRYFDYTHVTNDARMLISEKDYVEFAPHFKSSLSDAVKISDLKHLVESYELVERVISDHNKSFKECQIDIHALKSFVKKNPKIYPKRLKQAITDVESCQ